jgi:hypothetical protein
MKNKSEKQLKKFLKANKDNKVKFELRPQGDSNIISGKAINLCTIYINDRVYQFGGISEGFYDEMYNRFSAKK